MKTSPHLSESQYAPLKSGVVGDKPHSTAVGTSRGRSHLLPGSSGRVAGRAPVVCGNYLTLSHGKNADSPISGLWHRSLEKHMESNLSSSWRFHLAGPRPWCSHTGDLGRVAGAPSPLRWMGGCWLEFIYSTMCMKLLLQASTFGDTLPDSRNEADTIPGPQF